MEIKLIVNFHDLISNERNIVKYDEAYLKDNVLRYVEEDDSVCIITYSGNSISIVRESESKSNINLAFHDYSDCSIETSYGTLSLESYMISCLISNEKWQFEYQLFDNQGLISHIKTVLEFEGVKKYESN